MRDDEEKRNIFWASVYKSLKVYYQHKNQGFYELQIGNKLTSMSVTILLIHRYKIVEALTLVQYVIL